MARATYQTVQLSKGKHRGPEEGVCVMELASMLAGERFSDHPTSVCPVIGSFLRAYNDSIDGKRRQDLYAYAAKVVGSRGSEELQRVRGARLNAWALDQRRRRWTRFILPTWLRALAPQPPMDVAGARAVHAIHKPNEQSHQEVLELIDELLGLGTSGHVVPAAQSDAELRAERERRVYARA